jgi:autoinducer 2 (AI-2) kinase
VRANFEQLGEVVPRHVERFFVAGGLSRSDVFVQIVSNILDREVIPAAGLDSTALGAAICAAVASGTFEDLGCAVDALAQTRDPRTPEIELAEANAALYDGWSTLREAGAQSTTPAASALITPWVFRMSD